MEDKVPLYITDSLEALDALVQKEDALKHLKKNLRYSNVLSKMKTELLLCQDDQEKCYILAQRYVSLMDHMFKISDDPSYYKTLYLNDYNNVKELIQKLRADLEFRYENLSGSFLGSGSSRKRTYMSDSGASSACTISTTSEKHYIKPTSEVPIGGYINITGIFIKPSDLYQAIMMKIDLLILDTRNEVDFNLARLKVHDGDVINVPYDMLTPGLSANTLGQKLHLGAQIIWDNRDNYDLVILMDYDTESYNYSGSKLESLRNVIVEWDFNKKYKQPPVVLNGGIKEFFEWYPTEVDNSQILLSQANSEIDELLDLESVAYPETGAGIHMNLKVHSINSVDNLENRIARDFGYLDLDDIPVMGGGLPVMGRGLPTRACKSEGNLPKDAFQIKDQGVAGPYRSISEESLSKDYSRGSLDPATSTDFIKPSDELSFEDSQAIRDILAGDREELLSKARAFKPNFGETAAEGDRGHAQKAIGVNEKPLSDDDFELPLLPPAIDRNFKPARVQRPSSADKKEGFTGLRNMKNVCYMNCILQCLKVIPLIKETYVLTNKYLKHNKKCPPTINVQLGQTLKALWEGTEHRPKVYQPQQLKEKLVQVCPQYDKGNHEDTFEFFIFLFNLVSEDCAVDIPRPPAMTESEKAWYSHLQGRTSFLVDNFFYQLKNTKVCWQCRKPNHSFETDSTLNLPMRKTDCTLEELIADYLKDNLVTEYSCSDCKSTATIVNMKSIVVDPEVLVIVLKRYSIIDNNGTVVKNEFEVDFPVADLKFGNSKYHLYAIAQHTGTMTHGHYFATVLLDPAKDDWILFNDERIQRVGERPINDVPGIRSTCVGFFYVKQGGDN